MERNARRLTAFIAMLGLLFAQLSLAAFACPLDVGAVVQAEAPAMPEGCTGQHTAPVDGSLCELHCLATASIPSSPAPLMALLPAAPLVVEVRREAMPAMPSRGVRLPGMTMATAPPVALLFCRLLI